MVSFNNEEKESPAVLNWCRNLVDTLRDGGVWGIPRSGIVFKVDKKKQCLILTVGEETNEDFIATRRVFRQIGWDVLTQDESKESTDAQPGSENIQEPPAGQ